MRITLDTLFPLPLDPLLHADFLSARDGETNLYEKRTEKGHGKHLKINKLNNQEYLENELPLRKEARKRK